MEPQEAVVLLRRLNPGAIAAGAVVSFLAAIVLDFLLGLLIRGSPPVPGSYAFFVVLSGPLVAFLLGGYAAGRIAGRWGGLNGAAVVLVYVLLAFAFTMLIVSLIFIRIGGFGSGTVGIFFSKEASVGPSLLRSLLTMALVVAFFPLPLLCGYLGGRLGERHASSGGRGS